MCDKDHFAESVAEDQARGLVTRRQFGVLLGAGVAMMLPGVANAQAASEREVEIKTPDGTADAYFVYPAAGSAAAVLIWPDIFGLRPAMRTMAKRLAGSGYSVLVVNPFYRDGKPTATGATPIAEMLPFRKGMSPATDMTDAKTFIAWLDAQPQVNKNRKIGVQGYCMGGPMSFHTASAVPDRIGAVASFHGGGLVGKRPGEQSASAGGRHEGVVPDCHRRERRQAATDREDRAEGDVRQGQADVRDRGLPRGPRLVPAGHAGLQRAAAEKAWTRLLALYGKALA